MKYLGRIIVVSVILVIFVGVYLFFTAIERRADQYEQNDRALAVQKVAREVFSVHLCKGEFLTSCRGVAQDACSKEMREVLEKCSATELNGKNGASAEEQGGAVLTCALTQYLEVHPNRIKQDGGCAAPGEIDQKALNDDLFAAINKL